MGTTTGPCKLVLWAIAVLKSSVPSCKVRRRVQVASRYHDGRNGRQKKAFEVQQKKKKKKRRRNDDVVLL